jgi:hypothetical protein
MAAGIDDDHTAIRIEHDRIAVGLPAEREGAADERHAVVGDALRPCVGDTL